MRTIFIAVLVFVATAANASESKIKSVINLYGVTFSYGAPPWISEGDNPLEAVKPFRNQNGNDFLFELIPADEDFKSWNTMFAISALKNNRTIPVKLWRDYSLDALRQFCSGYKETVLEATSTLELVQVTCPKVVGAPMPGYDSEVGEIGVFAFFVAGNVLINHRIEWRGEAFDAGKTETWPVTPEQINDGLAELRKASAMSADGVVGFDQPTPTQQ